MPAPTKGEVEKSIAAVAAIEAAPAVRTTRTAAQAFGGTGVAIVLSFVYAKVFHETLDLKVALVMGGWLTTLATYVQNVIERGRTLKVLAKS